MGTSAEPGTLNEVALFLANTAGSAPSGTIAAQDATAVTIAGGRILGDTSFQSTTPPPFLNGAIVQGAGAAIYLAPDTRDYAAPREAGKRGGRPDPGRQCSGP